MKTLLISYDLRTPNRDYKGLIEAIKKANGWMHHLDSTWIITSDKGIKDWYANLRPFIDQNDYLLIIELIQAEAYGWMPKSGWEWIKSNTTIK